MYVNYRNINVPYEFNSKTHFRELREATNAHKRKGGGKKSDIPLLFGFHDSGATAS